MHCDLLYKALYALRNRFKIVASVDSTAGIFSALQVHLPQVAIISCDLQDGPLAGIRVLPVIRSSYPNTKSLVIIGSPDRELVVDAFKFGADGVFCRDDRFDLLCKAIEAVSRGQIWARSEELRYVLDAFVKSPKRVKIDPRVGSLLTEREIAVVTLAVEGLSNREISVQLALTEHTVKNYLFRVFDKLGISNRVELVLFCLCQEEAREKFSVVRKMVPGPRKALPAPKNMVVGE
jgi:DNA-binding NarL/FixJ family response regulator